MLLFPFSRNLLSNLFAENRLLFKQSAENLTSEKIIGQNQKLNENLEGLKINDLQKLNITESYQWQKNKSLTQNFEELLKTNLYKDDQNKDALAKRHAADLLLAVHEQLTPMLTNGAASLDMFLRYWRTHDSAPYQISQITIENGKIIFWEKKNDELRKITFRSGNGKINTTEFEMKSSWQGKKDQVKEETKENLTTFNEATITQKIDIINAEKTLPSFYSGKTYNRGGYHFQHLLSAGGFNPTWNQDGKWGDTTRKAWVKFQNTWNTDSENTTRQITISNKIEDQGLAEKEQALTKLGEYLTKKINSKKGTSKPVALIKNEPLIPTPEDEEAADFLKPDITAKIFREFGSWSPEKISQSWDKIDNLTAFEDLLEGETFNIAFSTTRENGQRVPDQENTPKHAALKNFFDYLNTTENFKNSQVVTMDDIIGYIGTREKTPYGLNFSKKSDLVTLWLKANDENKISTISPEAKAKNEKIMKNIAIIQSNCHRFLEKLNALTFNSSKTSPLLKPEETKREKLLIGLELGTDNLACDDHLSLNKINQSGGQAGEDLDANKKDAIKINISKSVYTDFKTLFKKSAETEEEYPAELCANLIFGVYDLEELKQQNCLKYKIEKDKTVIYLSRLPNGFQEKAKDIQPNLTIIDTSSEESSFKSYKYGYKKAKIEKILLGEEKSLEKQCLGELDEMFDPSKEPEIADKGLFSKLWRVIRFKDKHLVNDYRLRRGEVITTYDEDEARIPNFSEYKAGINSYLKKQMGLYGAEGESKFSKEQASKKFNYYITQGLEKHFLDTSLDFIKIAKKIVDDEKLQKELGINEEEIKKIKKMIPTMEKSRDEYRDLTSERKKYENKIKELKNPPSYYETSKYLLTNLKNALKENGKDKNFPLPDVFSLPETLCTNDQTFTQIEKAVTEGLTWFQRETVKYNEIADWFKKFKNQREDYQKNTINRNKEIKEYENKIRTLDNKINDGAGDLGSKKNYELSIDPFKNKLGGYLTNEVNRFLNMEKSDLSSVSRTFFETGVYTEALTQTAYDKTRAAEFRAEGKGEQIKEKLIKPADFPMADFIDSLNSIGIKLSQEQINNIQTEIKTILSDEKKLADFGLILNKDGVKAAYGTIRIPIGAILKDITLSDKEITRLKNEGKSDAEIHEHQGSLLKDLSLDLGVGYGREGDKNGVVGIFNPNLRLSKNLSISTGLLTNFGKVMANVTAFDVRVPLNRDKDLEFVFGGGFGINLAQLSRIVFGVGLGVRSNPVEQAKANADDLCTKKVQLLINHFQTITEELEKIDDKKLSDASKQKIFQELITYISNQATVDGAENVNNIINGGGVKLLFGPLLPFAVVPYIEFLVGKSTIIIPNPDNADNTAIEELAIKNQFLASQKEGSDSQEKTQTVPASNLQVNPEGKIIFNPNNPEAEKIMSDSNIDIADLIETHHKNYANIGLDVDYMTGTEKNEASSKGLLRLKVNNVKGAISLLCDPVSGIKLDYKTVEENGEKNHYIYLNVPPTVSLNISRLDRNYKEQRAGRHDETKIIIRDLNQDYKSENQIKKASLSYLSVPGADDPKGSIHPTETGYKGTNYIRGFEKAEINDFYGGLYGLSKTYKTFRKNIETEKAEKTVDLTKTQKIADDFWKNKNNQILFKKLSTDFIPLPGVKSPENIGRDWATLINKIDPNKTLNGAEIQTVLSDLTDRSFLDKKGNLLKFYLNSKDPIAKEIQAKLKELKNQYPDIKNDADLLSIPEVQKELTKDPNSNISKKINKELIRYYKAEFEKKNSYNHQIIFEFFKQQGYDEAKAKAMRDVVMESYKNIDWDKINTEGSLKMAIDEIMANFVGTNKITGYRYSIAQEASKYEKLEEHEFSLTDADPTKKAVAETILDTFSPIPKTADANNKEYQQEFLHSPLALRLLSIAPFIFESNVAESVLNMYNKPSETPAAADIANFQNFEALVRKVRELQKTGVESLDLSTESSLKGLNVTLKPIIIYFNTKTSSAIYERCINPTFNLVEGIKVEFKVPKASAFSALNSIGLHVGHYNSETIYYTIDTALGFAWDEEKKKGDHHGSGTVTPADGTPDTGTTVPGNTTQPDVDESVK